MSDYDWFLSHHRMVLLLIIIILVSSPASSIAITLLYSHGLLYKTTRVVVRR